METGHEEPKALDEWTCFTLQHTVPLILIHFKSLTIELLGCIIEGHIQTALKGSI